MKIYLKAGLVTLVCAGVIFVLFQKWSKVSQSEGDTQTIDMMNQMETSGLIDFKGVTLQGQQISLKQFQGKIVILNFWASWCGPCVEEFPSLLRLAEKMNGKVEVVAVSEDSAKEDIATFLKAFPNAQNQYFHIVWDEDRSIGRTYDAEKLPESYIADGDLKLAKKIVGSIAWDSQEAVQFMNDLSQKKSANH
jgi:thiol-disulfide isomerase/thioredoxin